jgi:2-octaprenyl-6-methoxyphenol hydroxylase
MDPEIVVRGAGPAGSTLALLLHAMGRRVTLVEARGRADGAAATRPIALSYASRIILERAGAWRSLDVTPIETVHVSQQRGLGTTRLTASDARVPALGYVIDYRTLSDALGRKTAAAAIDVVPDWNSKAPLVVHAEGSGHYSKEKQYDQSALVALVTPEPRASRIAFERFTSDGPLALLPLAESFGIVWAVRAGQANDLVAMPEKQFLAALQQAFGRRAGRFVAASGRSSVALALRVRNERTAAREAYVGNSAQALHPVAGQGLNLGLRDAWELARAIGDAPDPGAGGVLHRYAAQRKLDAFATIRVTDLLAELFVGASPIGRAARGAAMCALDACAPARAFLARRMIYGASALP